MIQKKILIFIVQETQKFKGKQLLSFVANKDSIEAEASMNSHGKTGGGQENTFCNLVT